MLGGAKQQVRRDLAIRHDISRGSGVQRDKPLFQGRDEPDTLSRLQKLEIPRPSQYRPGLAPEIDSIIMTALQRNPDERWQRASAMRTALTGEIGYEKTAGLARHAHSSGRTIREVAREKSGIPEDRLQKLLDPRSATVAPDGV